MNIGELIWKIKGDSSQITKAFKDTDTKAKKFAKIIKGVFTGAALVFFAKKVFDIGKAFIGVASDAEETRNKFNVVFADVADAARSSAEDIADSYGLSNEASEKYLSGVGDIVTGLGATAEQALETADTITRLSVDIDSFANLSGGAEQAVQALTSLFTGEREAAKALGIVINDTNLKAYAEGLGLVFNEMTPLEKGTLSLKLATEQSTLATGDFERSQGSFANQAKIAKSNIQDLSASIGEELLPAATKGITAFNTLIEKIIETREEAFKVVAAEAAVEDGTASLEQRVLSLTVKLTRLNESFALAKSIGQENVTVYEAQKKRYLDEISQVEDLLERQRGRLIQAGLQGELDTKNANAKAENDANLLRLADLAITKERRLKEMATERAAAEEGKAESAQKRFFDNIALEWELRAETQRIIEETRSAEELAEQERHGQRIANLQAELQAASQYAGNVGTIFNNLIQIQMAGDEELTDQKKRNIITLYRIQQAANIAQIAVDTAAGIVKAWASPGFPLAIPLTALIAGIGITQAAVVAATPPPVALAEGGVFPARPGGTNAIIGEGGVDEQVTVTPLNEGAGQMTLTVIIHDEALIGPMQVNLDSRNVIVDAGSVTGL